MNHDKRTMLLIGTILIACAAPLGCQRGGETQRVVGVEAPPPAAAPESEVSDAPDTQLREDAAAAQTEDGVRVLATPARDPWQRFGPSVDFEGVGVDPEGAGATTVETAKVDPPSAALGSDARSRPDWWMPQPLEKEDGRIQLTAEALGTDVLDARRNAVRAAREAITRALGRPPREERIEFATVRRLPEQVQSPGAARFVGYVLISARSETAG